MPLAQDLFTRTISTPPGGWGTADVGGTYTTVDAVDRLSVVPGAGRMTVTPSANASALLRSVSSTRVVYRASLSSSASYATAGANQSFSLIARGVTITSSSQTAYLARVRIETGNILRLYIIRKLAGVETPIGSAHSISLPQGYTPGQKIWCEVSVLDTNPTTLGAKMWLDGSSEPSLYQVQGTDTTPELQAAGTVGIQTYLSGIATTSITASYHTLSIAEPGKPNLMVNSQESNITWQVMQNGTPVDVKRWYVMQGGAPVLLKEGEEVEPPPTVQYIPFQVSSPQEYIAEKSLDIAKYPNIISYADAVALTGQTYIDKIGDWLGSNGRGTTILWLPERFKQDGTTPDPYLIDGSKGFMCAFNGSGQNGWVTGPNGEATVAAGAQPILFKSGVWMEIFRIGGIIGGGPGTVLQVENPLQMKRTNKIGTTELRVYVEGSSWSSSIGGNQYRIMSSQNMNCIFANFAFAPVRFGDVSFDTMRPYDNAGSSTRSQNQPYFGNLYLNKCSLGWQDIPPNEAAFICINWAENPVIEDSTFVSSDQQSSPIMWNNCRHSMTRNLKIIGLPNLGMPTHYRDSGTHIAINVDQYGNSTGSNWEECADGTEAIFERCHFNQRVTAAWPIQQRPMHGSLRITMTDCDFNPNMVPPVRPSMRISSYRLAVTDGSAKRSWVTITPAIPIEFSSDGTYPTGAWID